MGGKRKAKKDKNRWIQKDAPVFYAGKWRRPSKPVVSLIAVAIAGTAMLLFAIFPNFLTPDTKEKRQAPTAEAPHDIVQNMATATASDLTLPHQKLGPMIEVWLDKGGDLVDHFPLSEADAQSADDAQAICKALDAIYQDPSRNKSRTFSPLHRLAILFQTPGSRSAYEVFKIEGLPRLRKFVRTALNGNTQFEEDEILLALKILAAYRTLDDVKLIAEAVRKPYAQHENIWHVIFGFFDDHPYAAELVDALRDPLPDDTASAAFLNLCNELANEGIVENHPYNSESGRIQLNDWLSSDDPFGVPLAKSAAMAIPFIESGQRGALLELALLHGSQEIQVAGTWAQAKSGDEAGVAKLKEFSLDVNKSYVVHNYFKNLGMEEEIPPEAKRKSFRAMAEMSYWLQHPSEFGRVPSKIELFDERELFWPPRNEKRKVFLAKYTFEADDHPDQDADTKTEVGVGMVGTVTFALFGEDTSDLSAEDVYALHCCWELQQNGDERAPEKMSAVAGRKILAEMNEGF